jgi:F-type H+-transporting ATPase subunit delta
MTLLARRYAQALHALAGEQNAVDAVDRDLAALHAALAAKEARALLTSPDIKAPERAALLDKLVAGRSELVRNTAGVLQHRHRLEVLFDLYPAFHALVIAARGEIEGTVETALPLGDADVAALQALAQKLSGKQVHLTVALRPETLGGVRLRLGNVLYDGSLRAALDQLEQRLTQASI